MALALSIVLLLITVAMLPGMSFSLSSSVTSYNNTITIINDHISVPDGFKTKDTETSDGKTAVEIVSDGESFCGTGTGPKTAEISINATKLAIYIWFDSDSSGYFDLKIVADTSYDSVKIQRIMSGGSGYLKLSTGVLGNTGTLVNDGYTTIYSTSGFITITVTGYTSSSVPIHFSIVVVE